MVVKITALNQFQQNLHFKEEGKYVKEHSLVKFSKYLWTAKQAKVLNFRLDITWSCDSRGESENLFFSKMETYFREKIHSVSCLTRSFLCLEIEPIWVFAPCHKNCIIINIIFTMREESMDACNFVFLC